MGKRKLFTKEDLTEKKRLKFEKELHRLIGHQEYISHHLETHPCVDCGIADPAVLQFDHVRGDKEFAICYALSNGVLFEELVEEIAKCDVRCGNCHAKRHFPIRHQYLSLDYAENIALQNTRWGAGSIYRRWV